MKVDIKKLDSTDSFRLHSLEMDANEDREWLKFSDNLQSCLTDKEYTKTRNELIALKSINRAIPDINQRFRTKYYLTEATDQCVQAITLHGQEVKRSAKKRKAALTTDQINASLNLINDSILSVKQEMEANSNVKFEEHELRYAKVKQRKILLEKRAVEGALVKGGRKGWINTILRGIAT